MTVLLFGKLPAHGDFVVRGIAAEVRDAIDVWLAGSLAEAQAALGIAFEDAFDHAQPWRFAWAGADGRWTAGAIAPSVDAVGRRYPIVIARQGIADDAVKETAAAAEALLYAALAGGWDADRAVAAAGVPVPDHATRQRWTSASGWWTVGEDGDIAARIDGARPAGLLRSMLTFGEESR